MPPTLRACHRSSLENSYKGLPGGCMLCKFATTDDTPHRRLRHYSRRRKGRCRSSADPLDTAGIHFWLGFAKPRARSPAHLLK